MCAVCFPRVFQTTEEFILGRSEDCLCCQFLEWKLQVDLTVEQVHSERTYFNCYTVLLVDWKSLYRDRVTSFRVGSGGGGGGGGG